MLLANVEGGRRRFHASGGCEERSSRCFLPTLRISSFGQSAANVVPSACDSEESFSSEGRSLRDLWFADLSGQFLPVILMR